jgi:hypothetical protein
MTPTDPDTPLSPEELADLIPNLATKKELNEWERENILRAREWAISDRTTWPIWLPMDMCANYIRECSIKPGSGQASTDGPKETSGFPLIKSGNSFGCYSAMFVTG